MLFEQQSYQATSRDASWRIHGCSASVLRIVLATLLSCLSPVLMMVSCYANYEFTGAILTLSAGKQKSEGICIALRNYHTGDKYLPVSGAEATIWPKWNRKSGRDTKRCKMNPLHFALAANWRDWPKSQSSTEATRKKKLEKTHIVLARSQAVKKAKL